MDGRKFPWGEIEDASLGNFRDSRPESPQPEPVDAFPTAESVYGMGNAAGGVWDWTDSWFDDRRAARVLRGGSWNYAPAPGGWSAFRHGSAPRCRDADVGFRCAKSL